MNDPIEQIQLLKIKVRSLKLEVRRAYKIVREDHQKNRNVFYTLDAQTSDTPRSR